MTALARARMWRNEVGAHPWRLKEAKAAVSISKAQLQAVQEHADQVRQEMDALERAAEEALRSRGTNGKH